MLSSPSRSSDIRPDIRPDNSDWLFGASSALSSSQFVYWLGSTAVQRYLTSPGSYVAPFSHELTAVRLLARLQIKAPAPSAPQPVSRPRSGSPGSPTRGGSAGLRGSPSRLGGGMGGGVPVDPAVAEREAAHVQMARFTAWQNQQRQFGDSLGISSGEDDEGMHFWAYLTNHERLCDSGLSDGDHVWVDGEQAHV